MHTIDVLDRPPSAASSLAGQRIAILLPCYNEALTVATIVGDFQRCLPQADVYVFDNNSSDGTASMAKTAGAQVRYVALQGKGNVIRRMFADVDADIYIIMDGDSTYDAGIAPQLAERLVEEGFDMIVGARESTDTDAYRFGHQFGNRVLSACVGLMFGRNFTDLLSGYRVFSRRFVKSFAAHAQGFETETELTVHALELRMPIAEVATMYKARPAGSESKLSTYSDGARILWMIIRMVKAERPLLFFTTGFVTCCAAAVWLALPLLHTYLETGLVPRLPTAVLCASLVLLGTVLLACGLILDTVTKGRIEAKRFAYLSHAAPARRP